MKQDDEITLTFEPDVPLDEPLNNYLDDALFLECEKEGIDLYDYDYQFNVKLIVEAELTRIVD